jgi:hypothetical protein
MPKNSESLNRSLFDLLHSRGYDPTMLDTSGKEIPTPEEAEVFQFDFIKDGENYGKVTMSIDGAHKLIIYFNDKVADSEKEESESGDISWYKLLNQLKRFAQSYQLSFELRNVDNLKHDMAKREYMKKKESVQEGYYPMGKKASYSDNVPNVKMIIQHSRQIEEGEQRYRNVERIFLENEQGERFLAPTTKPGIARVYARHIAEGGNPHDERWNHIGSLCEEYQKMGAFVRATRNGQFNESTQRLVTEGVNHYQQLRENLSKLAGHRGYNAYFESYTPALMEDEGSIDLSEMFMSSSLDPRIESVMPILAKLSKNITEMAEVDELTEWADSLIEAPGAETLRHNVRTDAKNLRAFDLEEGEGGSEASEEQDVLTSGNAGEGGVEDAPEDNLTEEESLTSNNPVGIPESEGRLSPDTYELIDQYINKMDPGADREEIAKDIINGYTHTSELEYALQPDIDEGILDTLKKVGGKVLDTLGHEDDVLKDLQKKAGIPAHAQHGKPNMAQSNEKEVDESALQAYLGDKKYGKDGMEALRKAGQDHAGEKKMQNIRAKYSSKEDEVSEEVDMGQADSSLRNEPKQNNDKMDHFTALGKASKKMGHDHYMDVPDDKLEALRAMVKRFRAGEEVDEGETHTTRGGTVSHKDGVTKHQAGPGVYGGYDDTTHPDSPEEKHVNSPGAKTGHNTDQIKKFKFSEGQEDLDTIRRLLGK